MLFSTAKKLSDSKLELFYNNTLINTTNHYMYLGISIDSQVKLNEHFDKTINKATSRLKLLSLIRPSLTPFASLQTFRAMIQSTLLYGSSTYLNLNRTNIERVQSIDRRARKIVNHRVREHHTIEPTTNIIKRQACCLVKKCLLGETNTLMADYFERNNHNLGTRNQNSLIRLPRVRLEVARSGFFFMGAKLYNMLPFELRSLNNSETFKTKIKSYKFNAF